MLGLRKMPKEDINASPAELVYGSTLAVPGDFVPKGGPQEPADVQDHLREIRERVGDLKPVPTSAHSEDRAKFNVPDNLSKAKFVFVRRHIKKSPLQTPYDGPYAVLHRSDKFFTLKVGTREDNVSIDQLKAAYTEHNVPVQVAQPPRRGRPPVASTQAAIPDQQITSLPVPTYVEVTIRSGRTSKVPQHFRN